MRRAFLIVSAVFTALAVAPAATADKPTREILSSLEDFVVTDQCEFPVLVHTEGGGIATTFTDKEGDVVKELLVFPGNRQVFTNLDTDRSVTVATTGPGHFHFNSDGSGFLKVTGSFGLACRSGNGRAGDLPDAGPISPDLRRGRNPDVGRSHGPQSRCLRSARALAGLETAAACALH